MQYTPGSEFVVLLHKLHDLLERFLLFDVHAITYVFFVFPIVNHGELLFIQY